MHPYPVHYHQSSQNYPSPKYSGHQHHHLQKHQQSNHHYNNHPGNPVQSHVEHDRGAFPVPAQSGSHPGRKRDFHHSGRDNIDCSSPVKLYVAHVSRTATEQDIRSLFEEFGQVVEIVLFWDKISGERKGSCFVKYGTTEEADMAIGAMDNQCTFPGESNKMRIRYAAGESDHLGPRQCKLFVGCLNRRSSKKEVEEIFNPFGHIEEVYLPSDEEMQNRGYGFIQYSRRDMALVAIEALNGTYLMRGCNQPLIVRFADSSKPKNTGSRKNSTVGSSNFRHSQEPIMRPGQNLDGPHNRHTVPENSSSNPCVSVQHQSIGSQPKAVPEMLNQQPDEPCFIQQCLQPHPSELPCSSVQQPDALQETVSSSPDPSFGWLTHLQTFQQSNENLELQDRMVNMEQSSQIVGKSSCASPVAAVLSPALKDLPDCDWSEHISPDGRRYYYNSVTCESRWLKPAEFVFFEQQLKSNRQCLQVSSE